MSALLDFICWVLTSLAAVLAVVFSLVWAGAVFGFTGVMFAIMFWLLMFIVLEGSHRG